MAAALALGALFGALMGAVIHASGLQPFIVTLAGMFLARGLGFLIHLESIGIFDDGLLAIQMVHLPLPGGHILDINTMVLLAMVLAGWYLARMTPFGRNVYALGGDAEAARMMGLPVGRTRVLVHALGGACAALGGVVLTLCMSSGSHIEGVGLELDAIAAVVIGGTLLTGGVGSVLGTLIGVLIIGLIMTVITTYEAGFGSGATRVAIAALLLAFVLMQRGLSRVRRAE
jgi:simple sugar transport system permease protein